MKTLTETDRQRFLAVARPLLAAGREGRVSREVHDLQVQLDGQPIRREMNIDEREHTQALREFADAMLPLLVEFKRRYGCTFLRYDGEIFTLNQPSEGWAMLVLPEESGITIEG